LHTVISAVGALAAVCALVSGCDATVGVGGTPTVGKDALQTDIANRLEKAGEKPQSVTCKEDLIGELGKTARCEVVMSPPRTAPKTLRPQPIPPRR
jgi:predicted small secreted protein